MDPNTDTDELDENGVAYSYATYLFAKKVIEEGGRVTICLFTSEDDE